MAGVKREMPSRVSDRLSRDGTRSPLPARRRRAPLIEHNAVVLSKDGVTCLDEPELRWSVGLAVPQDPRQQSHTRQAFGCPEPRIPLQTRTHKEEGRRVGAFRRECFRVRRV